MDLLVGSKFPKKFIDWVILCVTTPSFTLSINGSLCGFFKGKKGIRQGDSMSPFLLVLAMEYFSRPMSMMSKREAFAFYYRCAPLKISHLIFAGDLKLFLQS